MTHIVLACPDMDPMAERIVADARGSITTGKISWGAFKDGFPNITIEDVDYVEGRDVLFLASLHSPEEIFRQLAVLYALPAYGVRSLTVVIPFFPTGTMDRVEVPGGVATAKTLARMLSCIPTGMERKPEILIFDIHALQEWHYFGDGVRVKLLSAMPLLEEILANRNDVAIAFPDEGAQKRFGRQMIRWQQILCDKVRSGDDRKVTIKEGDPRNKHVFIVDDLVQTGGTLLACKEALLSDGALSASAFVTHGVFPQQSWHSFIAAGFDTVWITDSCPLTALDVGRTPPFQVLSLSRLITQHILS